MPNDLSLYPNLSLCLSKVRRSSPRAVNDAIWYNTIESALALSVSFVINLAVVATNYTNFYSPTCLTLTLTLTQALPFTRTLTLNLPLTLTLTLALY